MATASKEEWTKEHEDALSGLTGLGIPKKEARQHLEVLPSEHSSELMRKALASRSRSQRPPPSMPAGAPANAMPLHPTSAAASAAPSPPPSLPPAPLPATRGTMPSAPLQIGPEQIQQAEAARQEAIRRASSGWGSLIPQAPIGPAAAQLQAQPPAPTPTEKPRVRVRAAGHYVPPAPLGAEAPSTETPSPTKAPKTPSPAQPTPSKQQLPRIRTEEELAKLEAGTEFVWIPDGHIYRKNAEGGEK